MTLSEFANIADIIAAVAIVLSICFLAYELHLTRKQSELANWRELLNSLSDYKGITNDLEFAAFIERAHEDYEALTPAQKRSFGLYLEQGVHIYGNFLKHNDSLPRKLDGLDRAIANSLRDMLTTRGGEAWWRLSREKGRFMPETYRIVDEILKP